MGWFDESDSEEEKPPSQNGKQENDDQAEDPLDAYMKSLEQTSQEQQAATGSTTKQRAERLDVQGEDEATSHWEEKSKRSKQQQEDLLDKLDESQARTNAAHLAMASTFHRAGKHSSEENNTVNDKKQVSLTLDQIQHDVVEYMDFRKDFWTRSDSTMGHAWREENLVTCSESVDPILNFSQVQQVLGEELVQQILKKGYTAPTLVQSQTLPFALSGRDAIVTAATGSGKTLAYVWPMVVHVCDQPHLAQDETGPIAIILVPTRELALQVYKHCKIMMQPLGGTCVAVTGGTSRYQLVQDLHKSGGVEVVVATPGRLLDVLSVKKNGLSLKRVTFLVLDEADKMLDMGFENQVSQVLKNIRPDRQSLLLSATMGRKVERVAQQWLLPNPVRIAVGRTGESTKHVNQHVMVLPSYQAKKAWLMEMIPILHNVGRTLVFVATRADCETLATQLRKNNIQIETLHGDRHQSDRNAALKAFARGNVSVLIATDVAARGLDVPNVATVVNFDVAKNLDGHVHRIGRAGRLSKDDQQQKGNAYTLLVTPKNADFAHVLVNAFEREGRQVSQELKELSYRSRKSGNVASRTKHNKSGLGFHEKDPSHVMQSDNIGMHGRGASLGQQQQPPSKRSRWE